jgi:putative antitoxin of VapBC-like toxin-antitoxin system
MKTTIEISDTLLLRAKRRARMMGKPLRALIEEGLRQVLTEERGQSRYHLPDRSVGRNGGRNPLESLSWQDLREEIYGSSRR